MPIDRSGAWVVTTRDRRFFRCHVDEVGPNREKRWIFIGADSTAHVGPAWYPIAHEGELTELVDEWWESKRHPGQSTEKRR